MKSKLLLIALLAALPGALSAGSPREKARESALDGAYADAVAAYNPLARGSRDAVLAAEYAYALALAGNGELALAHLDRAFLADAANPEVMFFGSAVFQALGMKLVANELHRPPPAWLAGGAPEIAALKLPAGEYPDLIAAANLFVYQRRYASAAAHFAALVRAYPDEQLPWAGYAIVLEKLGVFKAAAKAVEKDIKLAGEEDRETMNLRAAHKKELEARPPVAYNPAPKVNEMLKGRYLVFLGLNYTHTEAASVINLNTRLGKFLTNRIDAGASAGFTSGYDDSDYNGLSFGVSGRYNKPLPVSMPLNFTAGARFEYQPGPENNFAIVLSPGLSYVLANGALDLYLDFALTGPSKGTQTISLGYTIYFGGARK
ncbi:MAG: hypothetical protein HY550_07070 [Elusimicrobia bacterium]|nr:hypothetical protein [Elusimicrobiota bacterium]